MLAAIRKQLAHDPLVEARNRKPLRPNPLAPWELRVGRLRAFYEVQPPDPQLEALADVVYVLAVGKKGRIVLRIAREVLKKLALSTASRSLAEYASELDDEVILLTKRNRPFAAIVPLRNVDRESLALSTHPGFLALIERSRREVAGGKTLTCRHARRFGKREAST